MITSVLVFFIFTGGTGAEDYLQWRGDRSRKLRVGPERDLSGKHSLLELYHGNRDGQPSEHGGPQPPCSSHTESYFLLTSLSWPPLLTSWHISLGGLQGQPCPAMWGRPSPSFLLNPLFITICRPDQPTEAPVLGYGTLWGGDCLFSSPPCLPVPGRISAQSKHPINAD